MIALSGISKRYAEPVLCDVTLTVPPGCLFGLVGPGASGKSVLLRTIAGLVRPESGRVHVGDAELTGQGELQLQAIRARIGMLFQNNALFDFMTVGDNVAFPLRRLTDQSDSEIAARVASQLASVALAGFEPRLPASLSGGQKKRVGIARATITQAPFRLYDDPTAGLDPVTSQKIFELIRAEQVASGATCVVVSSDVPGLLGVVDRVAMLHRGRLVFEGTPAQARSATDPLARQFFRGETQGPL